MRSQMSVCIHTSNGTSEVVTEIELNPSFFKSASIAFRVRSEWLLGPIMIESNNLSNAYMSGEKCTLYISSKEPCISSTSFVTTPSA